MEFYKSKSGWFFSPQVTRGFGQNCFVPGVGLVMVSPMPENATEQSVAAELLPVCNCGAEGKYIVTHLETCPIKPQSV